MSKRKKQQNSLRDFTDINKYKRVISLSKTPELDGFMKSAGLVLLFIISMGLIGYIIFYVMGFLPM